LGVVRAIDDVVWPNPSVWKRALIVPVRQILWLSRALPVAFCLAVLMLLLDSGQRVLGQLVRQANTTLQMPSAPTSTSASYVLVDALNGLTFDKPVFVASPPGDNRRLFVVERPGRIVLLTNLDNPTRTIFLDITSEVYSDWETGKVEGLSSVAFHPTYLTDRFPFFYVTYTMKSNDFFGVANNYNRLARFQSTRANPNQADPSTELPLITQIDHGDGHNFNNAAFGPDGYLYMAAGDEGDAGKGDDFNNAQKIDKNFFSAILRIDVDKRPGNLEPNPHPANTPYYSIPADNPWVGATSFDNLPVDPSQVRTEFYAVGLRNPWRISFDPVTGTLYEGDVGQHAREEINIIVKGGNYGWSFMEGTVNGPKGPPPPGLNLIPPIHEHSPGYGPDQGFCIIGGVVYHGPRLPELEGAYIFADYVSGNIWALRWDGSTATPAQLLANHPGIAGFGYDPRDGEMLIADHDGGKILRLDHAQPTSQSGLPPTLADTGVFSDLSHLTPNAGIVPYEVNVPFWSDGAQKQRWFSIPNPSQTMTFDPRQSWTFPSGTVWVKHFELTNTVSGVPRRVETRLLVKNDQGVYGVTYRWSDSQDNAVLVPAEGLDDSFLVQDQGVVRTQVWHYPSQAECLACHTPVAGYALGFNTAQLNRNTDFGTGPINQIQALGQVGYFQSPVSPINTLPALANLDDTTVSREYRVRSFLAADCAQCHQPGGPAHGQWDARLSTPLANAGLINGPLYNNTGDPNNRVIVPGSPSQSMLLTRLSQLGTDHMPPLATTVIDTQAVNLINDWITQDLPSYQDFPTWQVANFGSTDAAVAAPDADPDQDGASNFLEYLTGTNPNDQSDVWKISIQRTDQSVIITFPQAADRAFEVDATTNLADPNSWQPLDVPDNRPFFAASPGLATVHDPVAPTITKFYRVSVRGP
jgi:uncharacterized repeat protein (TIGR03806 family)